MSLILYDMFGVFYTKPAVYAFKQSKFVFVTGTLHQTMYLDIHFFRLCWDWVDRIVGNHMDEIFPKLHIHVITN